MASSTGRGGGNGTMNYVTNPIGKTKKKNAYVLFVYERRKEEEAKGHQMPKELKDLIPLFSDEWQSMDEYEKEPFKAKARQSKEATFGEGGGGDENYQEESVDYGVRCLWNPLSVRGRAHGILSHQAQDRKAASGRSSQNSRQNGATADDEDDNWF